MEKPKRKVPTHCLSWVNKAVGVSLFWVRPQVYKHKLVITEMKKKNISWLNGRVSLALAINAMKPIAAQKMIDRPRWRLYLWRSLQGCLLIIATHTLSLHWPPVHSLITLNYTLIISKVLVHFTPDFYHFSLFALTDVVTQPNVTHLTIKNDILALYPKLSSQLCLSVLVPDLIDSS